MTNMNGNTITENSNKENYCKILYLNTKLDYINTKCLQLLLYLKRKKKRKKTLHG